MPDKAALSSAAVNSSGAGAAGTAGVISSRTVSSRQCGQATDCPTPSRGNSMCWPQCWQAAKPNPDSLIARANSRAPTIPTQDEFHPLTEGRCETKFCSSPKTPRKWGLRIGDPHLFAEGQPAEHRGRFALGPRFVPNRSVRIGTGAEPPHSRDPAARCELRQLALRTAPVPGRRNVILNQSQPIDAPRNERPLRTGCLAAGARFVPKPQRGYLNGRGTSGGAMVGGALRVETTRVPQKPRYAFAQGRNLSPTHRIRSSARLRNTYKTSCAQSSNG